MTWEMIQIQKTPLERFMHKCNEPVVLEQKIRGRVALKEDDNDTECHKAKHHCSKHHRFVIAIRFPTIIGGRRFGS
jgi:hypothetical protein